MSIAAQPNLEPGRAYRTHELRHFGANPTRLAKRLVAEGKLQQACHGLFYAPVQSRFGQAPPSDEVILRGFLGSEEFVITGPPKWNALGLGATAMFASTLVYNKKRTGEFALNGRRFLLRRVFFPKTPSPVRQYALGLKTNFLRRGKRHVHQPCATAVPALVALPGALQHFSSFKTASGSFTPAPVTRSTIYVGHGMRELYSRE